MIGVLVAWLRLDVRRRWRSLLVLSLLVALAAGTVMTAVAAARRGGSAVDRLLDQTLPATVVAQPNQPGFDWDAVRALPEVEAVAEVVLSDLVIDELPGGFYGYPIGGDEALRTIERPVVLEGRPPNPTRPDEIAVVPGPPSPLAQIRQIVAFPVFLAWFLAVLALGTVGHALATAVRRRRHDVAVLRAVGMTRTQTRGLS